MTGHAAYSWLKRGRPGLLASVRSRGEAMLALQAGVDVLDLKNPEHGALGALDRSAVAEVCRRVGGRCPVSATIGDLPPDAQRIARQTEAWISTGLDFVKIGFFSGDYLESCLGALRPLTKKARLIAVLFADRFCDVQGAVTVLKHAGFAGVMLDTADKSRGSIRSIWKDDKIAAFVEQARARRLISGVAGSLGCDDLAPLCKIGPDYLGFRTALCENRQRTKALSADAIAALSQKISACALSG